MGATDAIGKLRLLATFTENKENAYTTAFSADGKRFAAAGGLRAVFIYDTAEQKPVGGLADHKQSVYSVKFSKNGKWFFSTGRDGKVMVYDTEKFDKITELLPDFDLESAHPESVPNFALAIHPDQSRLFVGGSGGFLRIYSTEDWSLQKVLPLHQGNIRSISCSPDGQMIATGSSDKMARIIDAKTYEVLHNIEGHGETIFSVRFSPDGTHFATGGKDARLRIWTVDGKNIKPKVKLLAHTFTIKCMEFLRGSKELVTVSQDKTIKIWDLEKMLAIETIDRTQGGHIFTINSVSVSPDETRMVTGSDDKTVKLWELLPG